MQTQKRDLLRRAKIARILLLSSILTGCCFVSLGIAEQPTFHQVEIRYAQGFSIDYLDNAKLVTVFNPWQATDLSYQYLLVQRGTSPPKGYEDIPHIEIPVRSVVTLSTTHLAYLEQLDLLDTLVGYGTFDHVYSAEARTRIAAGQIREIGDGANVNVEVVMDLNPDLIMTYAIGSPYDAHFKLVEANLKVVINAEYLERTPLGRAEWIKFLAAFFNKEAEADAIFDRIAAAYEAMAAKTQDIDHKPTVFLNAPYEGNWWISGGKTYLVKLLADAGAHYLWADDPSSGSRILDFEAVYETAANAEYWLNPGQADSLTELLSIDERLAAFEAFQTGNVYNNNARVNQYGGNDYWESGLTRPDLVV
ncbi:ABC transporter substrate-binding protein, partial [candidate division KSB3 bacterium]|nr:ABC transporter substrate-binding protein [candidate division KSB3 bacterium]MBD3326457.1 ABC transporter substrate-binding protein [candidate division KSB3 bacterium]